MVEARYFRVQSISRQGRKVERLWQEFFSDPSQWCDNRSEKINAKYPDFKQKTTEEGLWLDSRWKPPWVEDKLADLPAGSVRLDIFSWNTRLARSVKAGEYSRTLELFQQMECEHIIPNKFTFVQVLNACSSLQALEKGRRIHKQIMQLKIESDAYVGNCLIDMYAKCGSIDDALIVFNKIPVRDVVCWTTLILVYAKCGQGQKALELFGQMQQEGVEPDPVTFLGMLNACASLGALGEGRRVHELIIESGCQFHVFVGSCLVDMYIKCGSIEDAWRVFDKMPTPNVVVWNAIIHGYARGGQGQKALEVSQQMQSAGIKPDRISFVGMLNACASMTSLKEGRRVHEQIIERDYESDVFVGSCLVNMYAKCGSVGNAWKVFNKLPTRNVVAWTAMILGHVKSGRGQKALDLFQQMQQEGVEPDPITFLGVLNACASLLALGKGRHVHEEIIRRGWESDVSLGNCLVDMYAKCGSIEDARKVFNKMASRDVVSWTSMLGGYALHGNAKDALVLFGTMWQEGVGVTVVSLLSLLSACSHGGLVEEGLHYLKASSLVYGISATEEHYACIVDLLGRAGRLHEAEDLIKLSSCESNTTVWMSLLGACRVHCNVEMGERIANLVLNLDPEIAAR